MDTQSIPRSSIDEPPNIRTRPPNSVCNSSTSCEPHPTVMAGIRPGFSLNMNLHLEGRDIIIQIENPSNLAQIIMEGLRIGLDNVANHSWLTLMNPLPQPNL